MKFLDELTQWLNKILLVIAGVALTAIVVLTVGNIFSRNLWAPIKGMVELVGFCGAIAAAFALGFAQVKRAHIAVDVLVLKFSRRTQKLLSAVNAILGVVFCHRRLAVGPVGQYAPAYRGSHRNPQDDLSSGRLRVCFRVFRDGPRPRGRLFEGPHHRPRSKIAWTLQPPESSGSSP